MSENASTPEETSSTSWSDLLAELIRGFVLLRDVFGYVLPGAFFLLIGAMLGHLSMFGSRSQLPGAELHPWLFFFVLLVISYLAGQFIVATSYLVEDVPRILRKVWYKLAGKTEEVNEGKEKEETEFLRLHGEFAEIYIEYDRQSIIALLRRGLAASVVLAILVFYYLYAHPLRIIAAAGAIMLFNAISGHSHLKKLKHKTLLAARDAEIRRPSVKRI
jgi:hypothetical protein